MKAPKLWPAEPLKRMRIVSSGRPLAPYLRVTSLPGDRADDAMHVANRQLCGDALAALDRRLAQIQQLRDVERLLQAVILLPSGSSGRCPSRRPAGTAGC
jgi:hypothetical protein